MFSFTDDFLDYQPPPPSSVFSFYLMTSPLRVTPVPGIMVYKAS